ncbi:hypothetical protein EK904_012652, partial [Melospiza melodia maxima]
VHEAVPCYSECNQYSWEVGPWSPCKISSEENSLHCGEGIQTREVRCVSTAEDHGVETVPNALCSQAEVPEAVQKCTLYCPSECAVSDWGQWSPCPQLLWLFVVGFEREPRSTVPLRCSTSPRRVLGLLLVQNGCAVPLRAFSSWIDGDVPRSGLATIELLFPGIHGGSGTPTSDRIKSVTKRYTELPALHIVRTGVGLHPASMWPLMCVCDPNVMQTRTRQVLRSPTIEPCTCAKWIELIAFISAQHVHSDVAVSSQDALHLEKPVPTSSRCVVPCAVDCQLSPWSAWSQCSHTCGAGAQHPQAQLGSGTLSRGAELRESLEPRPNPSEVALENSQGPEVVGVQGKAGYFQSTLRF